MGAKSACGMQKPALGQGENTNEEAVGTTRGDACQRADQTTFARHA